jgi:hypothetical protein
MPLAPSSCLNPAMGHAARLARWTQGEPVPHSVGTEPWARSPSRSALSIGTSTAP